MNSTLFFDKFLQLRWSLEFEYAIQKAATSLNFYDYRASWSHVVFWTDFLQTLRECDSDTTEVACCIWRQLSGIRLWRSQLFTNFTVQLPQGAIFLYISQTWSGRGLNKLKDDIEVSLESIKEKNTFMKLLLLLCVYRPNKALIHLSFELLIFYLILILKHPKAASILILAIRYRGLLH